MTLEDRLTQTRVTSRDGTQIAYWTSGDGPPLVLVHGTTADHTRWRPVLPHLEPHVTVHAMDRRGRGASGDAAAYDLTREYEDVAAVVNAVAATSGSAVDLLGHSFGGLCAFEAALLTPNVRKLVLYEGWPAPNPDLLALTPDVERRMEALLADGMREAALEVFIREEVGMPDHEFAAYRALPAWQARIDAAHTILRESRTVPGFDAEEARRLTMPVLLIVGADSPPALKCDYETVAEALPDPRVVVLEGQQHIAMDLVPEVFTSQVLRFLRD